MISINNEKLINELNRIYIIITDCCTNGFSLNELRSLDIELSRNTSLSTYEKMVVDEINAYTVIYPGNYLLPADYEIWEKTEEYPENRFDKKNMIEIFCKILKVIDVYKYNIHIDTSIQHALIGYDVNESCKYYLMQIYEDNINLKQLSEEGINYFGLNELSIIDFVRIHLNYLLNNGVEIFYDQSLLCLNNTERIENILKFWQENKKNADKIVIKIK